MRLITIRHLPTDWNLRGIMQGQRDIALVGPDAEAHELAPGCGRDGGANASDERIRVEDDVVGGEHAEHGIRGKPSHRGASEGDRRRCVPGRGLDN